MHDLFLTCVGEIDLNDGYGTVSGDPDAQTWGAMLRALADAVVPEEPEPRQQDMTEEEFWQYDPTPRHERQRIRALLLAEAQRAEQVES